MRFQIVGYTIGILLLILGIALLVPAVLDMNADHSNASVFLGTAALAYFFGGTLYLSCRSGIDSINVREAIMLTTLSWVIMSLFGALPLYFADIHISFTDAIFETVSGITTTGSTVLAGLDGMSRGILLWRSLIQWIGGIGIVGFAIVILPFLRVGGMQLFRTESSDRSEKAMPRTAQIAGSLLIVYVLLSAFFCVTYKVLGMSWFDAVNHAMTTIATAGYSTHDSSFGYFDSYALDMAATIFMIMSGLPFILYVRFFIQRKFVFFNDEQSVAFIKITAALIGILTIWLWKNSDYTLADSFRYVAFNLASVTTTTGYASTNYVLWGSFASVYFLFVTYLGACAGSTAGGPKTMRLIIAFKAVGAYLHRLIYPHSTISLKYQEKPLSNEIIKTVFGFLGLYVTANVFFTLCLTATGVDLITAMSGVATAIANVGCGIGDIIGPAGNFSRLPALAKWLLCLCMLLGRLEIIPILIFFTPGFWRK